jgi:hypothetical protein
MPTIDQYSDAAYAVLVKQARRMPTFAEFVKEAEIDNAERDSLPVTAFAWPEERKFPIHTDKHAALSYVYAKAQAIPAHITAKIAEALDIYGIDKGIFAEPVVKVAADSDDVWLLPDIRRFPVRTAADVKTAELRLLAEFPKLDLEHRATACTNLVKKASNLGVELHPATKQFAGMVLSSTKMASEWLDVRANLAKDGMIKAAYEKLAEEMRKCGPEIKDRESLVKVASVVAELDQKAGFVKYYDRKMPDALRTVFNTEKEAANSVDVAGRMFSVSKLASLPATFWGDLGGPELANEVAPGGKVAVEKLATIVETLPLDLKIILRSQLGA